MGEFDLIGWLVENANSQGEDFNHSDERPGWLTAEWLHEYVLEVTYENPANEKVSQRYRVTKVVD